MGCVPPSSRSPRPRDQTHVSCVGRRVLHHQAAWQVRLTQDEMRLDVAQGHAVQRRDSTPGLLATKSVDSLPHTPASYVCDFQTAL